MARSATNEFVPPAFRRIRNPYSVAKGLLCLGWHQSDIVSWVREQSVQGHLPDDFSAGTASKLAKKINRADSTSEPDTDLTLPPRTITLVRDQLEPLRKSNIGRNELLPYTDSALKLYERGLTPHDFAHVATYVVYLKNNDLTKHQMVNTTANFLEWYKSLDESEQDGIKSLVPEPEEPQILEPESQAKLTVPMEFRDLRDPYKLTKGLIALAWSEDDIVELITREYNKENLHARFGRKEVGELKKQLNEGKAPLPPKTLEPLQTILQPYREAGGLGTSELRPFFIGAIKLKQNRIDPGEFDEFMQFVIDIFQRTRKKQSRHRGARELIAWFQTLEIPVQHGLMALDELSGDNKPISLNGCVPGARTMEEAHVAKTFRLAESPYQGALAGGFSDVSK